MANPSNKKQKEKKPIDLNEVIPIEDIINPLVIEASVIEQEMKKNEAERQAFIKANTEPAVKPTEQQQQEFNAIVDQVTENIKQAVAEPKYEPVKEDKPSPITARFTTKEINGRTDLQLITDTIEDIVKTVEGITCKVYPVKDVHDLYNLEIYQNGEIKDTFKVYGSSIYGKGVPVLWGNVEVNDDCIIREYIPLRNEVAVRANIFRNVAVKNIDGEFHTMPKGAAPALMEALNFTIAKDRRIFDYVNLEEVSFNSDLEFVEFVHHLALVLNKYQIAKGLRSDLQDFPPFRVSSYKNTKKYHLVSDQAAFKKRHQLSVMILDGLHHLPLPNTSAVSTTIEVKGKKLIVREPGNKITNLEIKVDG